MAPKPTCFAARHDLQCFGTTDSFTKGNAASGDRQPMHRCIVEPPIECRSSLAVRAGCSTQSRLRGHWTNTQPSCPAFKPSEVACTMCSLGCGQCPIAVVLAACGMMFQSREFVGIVECPHAPQLFREALDSPSLHTAALHCGSLSANETRRILRRIEFRHTPGHAGSLSTWSRSGLAFRRVNISNDASPTARPLKRRSRSGSNREATTTNRQAG